MKFLQINVDVKDKDTDKEDSAEHEEVYVYANEHTSIKENSDTKGFGEIPEKEPRWR